MADGNLHLPLRHELVVDLFAGGGGASMGIARAYREPDVAVNHNAIAVAVHRANHPQTRHFQCDVFEVDPLDATGGQPVAVLWASPDCRHHSKAAGGKPRSKRVRGLAWVVTRWAKAGRPRIIHLENVEEFADWGPLLDDGKPCQIRKGVTFRRWVRSLERLGYRVEHRELVAADYGAPTIRKRLYVIARCDGHPIAWPKPSHGKDGMPKRWRTAAECIDFSLPARSIFERPKPLADNTCKRVAKGTWRYVLDCELPYIVDTQSAGEPRDETESLVRGRMHGGQGSTGVGSRALRCPARQSAGATGARSLLRDRRSDQWGEAPILHDGEQPIGRPAVQGGSPRLRGSSETSLIPFLTEHANASNQRTFPADEPLRTQCAQVKGGHFSLVAAHVTKFRTGSIGSSLHDPLPTITAGGAMARPAGAAHALGMVSAHFMEQANGGFYDGDGRSVDAPLSTVCTSGANQRLVSAYLVKYYGNERDGVSLAEPMHTIPTKDRMGLVQIVQVPADILAPDMLAKAKRCADFMHRYLPERFPEPADLVLVGDYVLIDITLRMLVPAELAQAQGFDANYIIDRGLFETGEGTGQYEWRAISKTDQVRLIGNSVCPDVAEALVRANAAPLIEHYRRTAA